MLYNLSQESSVLMTGVDTRPAGSAERVVATKAVLSAAARLGLSNKVLGRIIGLSEATVSRMGSGAYTLAPGEKPFEIAMLLVRLFRSLDAIAGGDEAVAAAWLRAENMALGGTPLGLIESLSGLVHVLGYLDARRALA